MNVLSLNCWRAISLWIVRRIGRDLPYGSRRLKRAARQLLSVRIVLQLKERHVEFAYPFFFRLKGLFAFCLTVRNALLPTWVPTTNSRINAAAF